MGSGLRGFTFSEIIKGKMAPIGRDMEEKAELMHLKSNLDSIVTELNSRIYPFHAHVDKSGALPQIYFTRK